jgi:hypothetical protein
MTARLPTRLGLVPSPRSGITATPLSRAACSFAHHESEIVSGHDMPPMDMPPGPFDFPPGPGGPMPPHPMPPRPPFDFPPGMHMGPGMGHGMGPGMGPGMGLRPPPDGPMPPRPPPPPPPPLSAAAEPLKAASAWPALDSQAFQEAKEAVNGAVARVQVGELTSVWPASVPLYDGPPMELAPNDEDAVDLWDLAVYAPPEYIVVGAKGLNLSHEKVTGLSARLPQPPPQRYQPKAVPQPKPRPAKWGAGSAR